MMLVFAVVPTQEALQTTVGDRQTVATMAAHFLEYAVLAALVALSCRDARPRARLMWGLGVAVGMSAMTEALQVPLPYRDAELRDLVVNLAGSVAGLLLVSRVAARRAPAPRSRRG